jgi:DNA invertase Pin-like site-specific DNA recombinase
MKYGYARVSTDGQSVGQVVALRAAGAVKVFREGASGTKSDRSQLRKAVTALGAGDVLMVTRLDRLARSTRDLLNTLAASASPDCRSADPEQPRFAGCRGAGADRRAANDGGSTGDRPDGARHTPAGGGVSAAMVGGA